MSISYHFLCSQECGGHIWHKRTPILSLRFYSKPLTPLLQVSMTLVFHPMTTTSFNYYQTWPLCSIPYLSIHTETFISGINSSINFCKTLEMSVKLNTCRANIIQNSVEVTMTKFAYVCLMSHHRCHLVDRDYVRPSILRPLILEIFKYEKCAS